MKNYHFLKKRVQAFLKNHIGFLQEGIGKRFLSDVFFVMLYSGCGGRYAEAMYRLVVCKVLDLGV